MQGVKVTSEHLMHNIRVSVNNLSSRSRSKINSWGLMRWKIKPWMTLINNDYKHTHQLHNLTYDDGIAASTAGDKNSHISVQSVLLPTCSQWELHLVSVNSGVSNPGYLFWSKWDTYFDLTMVRSKYGGNITYSTEGMWTHLFFAPFVSFRHPTASWHFPHNSSTAVRHLAFVNVYIQEYTAFIFLHAFAQQTGWEELV